MTASTQNERFEDFLSLCMALRVIQKLDKKAASKATIGTETRLDLSLPDIKMLGENGESKNLKIFARQLHELAYTMREAQKRANPAEAERLEKRFDAFLQKRGDILRSL